MLGSVFSQGRPIPKAMLTTTTIADGTTNRRDQKPDSGSFSTILLFRGTAQFKNQGYIPYAQAIATSDPRTPPNPSSRSGLACTINKLPNPRDAQTIDQNEAGKVMRRASIARSDA